MVAVIAIAISIFLGLAVHASRHKPMGCPGCSCYLKPARPDATGL